MNFISISKNQSPPIDTSQKRAISSNHNSTPQPIFDICQHIYQLVCQNSGTTHDPSGSVRPDTEGENQALRLYKEIIQSNPSLSIEQVNEALVTRIFEPKQKGRIESAYRWSKSAIKRFIDRQPPQVFTAQEKHQIKARLDHIQLQLPPPASIYDDEPDLLTKSEVYYERMINGEMRLRVGGAFLFISKSWFNLIFTLAHEQAHSIDPCEIRAARLSFPAYDQLTACFLQNHLIRTGKDRSECGAHDQLSETFADWIAVQVTAEALHTFSTEFHGQQIINAARNSVRDLCAQENDGEDLDVDFHPSPQIRIESIFGRNPKIRQLLGCDPSKETPPYCTFDPGTPVSQDTHFLNYPGGIHENKKTLSLPALFTSPS